MDRIVGDNETVLNLLFSGVESAENYLLVNGYRVDMSWNADLREPHVAIDLAEGDGVALKISGLTGEDVLVPRVVLKRGLYWDMVKLPGVHEDPQLWTKTIEARDLIRVSVPTYLP